VAKMAEIAALCSGANPDSRCGMFQDNSPRTLATIQEFLKDPALRRAIAWAISESAYNASTSEKNEAGFWAGEKKRTYCCTGIAAGIWREYAVYAHTASWNYILSCSPVSDGRRTRVLAGTFPATGYRPNDLGLAARHSVMIIVRNTEQRRLYWKDYRGARRK
jgi:hypothetical protein